MEISFTIHGWMLPAALWVVGLVLVYLPGHRHSFMGWPVETPSIANWCGIAVLLIAIGATLMQLIAWLTA